MASSKGWYAEVSGVGTYYIRLCSHCNGPTFFIVYQDEHFPVAMPGASVPNVPDELATLYEEARSSASASAPTAAVLVCRKILMSIAVTEGAPEGKRFIEYVEFLDQKGFVPPKGKAWVDYMRTKGNEATHEIALMDAEDARAQIEFAEMLLRYIYDFPKRVPPKPAVSEP